jgi:hypothetical protein
MSKKDTENKKKLDLNLLTEVITALNISRKSIGLYPVDHPISAQSLESAFISLNNLLAEQKKISIGVGKKTLLVENENLDANSVSFQEYAQALHEKGIAGISFSQGISKEELIVLNGILTDLSIPSGPMLLEVVKKKNLKHIDVIILDTTKLRFVEGSDEERDINDETLKEEFIRALLEGRLAENQEANVIFNMAPRDIGKIFSVYVSQEKQESYQRLYQAFFRKKTHRVLNRDSLNRFLQLVESLSPDIRAVKTLLGKLAQIKQTYVKDEGQQTIKSPYVDDFQLSDDLFILFNQVIDQKYVDDYYTKDLRMMLFPSKTMTDEIKQELNKTLNIDSLDNAYSDLLIDLVNSGKIRRDDILDLLTKLSELTFQFLETGRFEEVLNIHNKIYSYMLQGDFKTEASGMLNYFFNSELFTSKLIDAFRIWGRLRRDDTLKLARVLRTSVTVPLLDALCNEESSAYRKFYISILSQLGKEVLQEASERLNNDRWFVVRNMIYLLRECGGLEYLQSVRNLTRHNNDRVQLEALKTLVYFKDPSGVPQLMSILKRKDRWLKEQAIKICGIYRIEETLPYLENILKKRDIFSSHLYLKLAAINALCRIGSPRAFDTLKKVFTEKVHLYKGTQAELQSEVIKSMENYSDAGVKSILKLAMNSEHEEIRELARKTFSGGNSG